MGRIGSCVPRHTMLALLAPHCWKATSLADPEYVMDLTSPSAFWALAMTALASCAAAVPGRAASPARLIAIRAFLMTVTSPIRNDGCGLYSGKGRVGIRWRAFDGIWSVRDVSTAHPGRT